eukprot:s1316_g13.t1
MPGRRRKLEDEAPSTEAKQKFTKGDWLLRHLPGEDMLADLGTKTLTSARMEKLKKGLGMRKIGGEEEKTAEEPEEKKTIEKKEKKIEKGTRVLEEVEKALQCVALMIAIRGAKAQDEEEEHVEHAELFHVALVMVLAMFGLVSEIQRIVPSADEVAASERLTAGGGAHGRRGRDPKGKRSTHETGRRKLEDPREHQEEEEGRDQR